MPNCFGGNWINAVYQMTPLTFRRLATVGFMAMAAAGRRRSRVLLIDATTCLKRVMSASRNFSPAAVSSPLGYVMAIDQHFVMKMWPGRASGAADIPDGLPLAHPAALFQAVAVTR